MNGYQADGFNGIEVSIALTADLELLLVEHFDRRDRQEDLTFAYWQPSKGVIRYTAVLQSLALPRDGDRELHGNASFNAQYLSRVIDECPPQSGIAFLHSHLGPGWQAMSHPDVVAERDRLASVAAGATGLPLVGLTFGTDHTWSGRIWLRVGPRQYERLWASTVRSVGKQLKLSFHPELRPRPQVTSSQMATVSVWGEEAQADLSRAHIGIVGLGSVGSIVAEALSRTGTRRVSLIDHDILEERNLDRTLGAYSGYLAEGVTKVESARRMVTLSHTAQQFEVIPVENSLLTDEGLARALDCDALICCVDRPWPRHVLNTLAFAHLIPVVDGGILARVDEQGHLKHVDWRIHTIGPGRACLYCLGALLRSDAALDRDGMLDDPDYINGLSHSERERYGRRNVFAFSLSVAAHEVLQLVGLISGSERVGGTGPQAYHAYPGVMEAGPTRVCDDDCDVRPLTGSASSINV